MSETLQRIASVSSKEFIHIVRDRRNFFLVFISPAFTLVMLAYLFAWDVDHFALAVFDQDKSSLSRQYISALTQDDSIELRHDLSNSEELDALLLTDRVHGVLVIPPGLMDRVNKGQTGHLQVIIDGTNLPLALQMLGQLGGRTQALLTNMASLPDEVESRLAPIDIRTRVWYNPNLRVLHSMVPGLVALVMCMPAFSIATSIAREKEMGTMEGLFATPVQGAEFLVGKLLAYIAAGLVSAVLVVLVAILWFRVPFQGNFLLFLFLTADFLLGVLGLSLLLANSLPSQQAATVVLFLILWTPSMFISGLIDPVDRTSLAAQLQSSFLPTTHYITITRGIFLKGGGWRTLWPATLALAAMGMAYLLLAIKLFKKRLG
jgi:ABC-type multidrug transport system permease subunit